MATPLPDLGLGLEGAHILVTGGAGFIGSHTVAAFLSAGAFVTCLDINPQKSTINHSNLHVLHGDISSEESIQNSFAGAVKKFGTIHTCVALAGLDLSVLPHHDSLLDMPLAQWQRTFKVNVEGTFLTAREWMRNIKAAEKDKNMRNVGLIIVGSECGWFGEWINPDYATGKAAVQVGLLQSLKRDVVKLYPTARVNAIAPGPVDTPQFRKECAEDPEQYWRDAQATSAQSRPVPMTAIAKGIVYLASENWSSHVHGQVLNVDGGKFGHVQWTQEEGRNMSRPE